ncbi:MAG TPA: hypothetical protein VM681_00985 [Candidatus Thermoplasmatota archaeon]|nr:hypothetical protein [Candidatus Thermoplasmatota archaeon]
MTPPTHGAAARTLGAQPAGGPRCLFCGTSLEDEGPAFMDHIAEASSCRVAHQEWINRLDEDRLGGG